MLIVFKDTTQNHSAIMRIVFEDTDLFPRRYEDEGSK